jgi:hypothetical protein
MGLLSLSDSNQLRLLWTSLNGCCPHPVLSHHLRTHQHLLHARLPKFLRQTLKDRFYASAPAPEFQNRRLSPETIQTPHAGARPRLSSTEMHQSIRPQVCNETRHQQLQQIPPPWTPETSKILVKKAWNLSRIFHVRGTIGPANSSNTLREQGTTTIRCTIRVATRPHLGKNSIQAPFFRKDWKLQDG